MNHKPLNEPPHARTHARPCWVFAISCWWFELSCAGAHMEQTVPHRQTTARQNTHTWRTVLQLSAAWWWRKNQTEKAFASVLPCNGFAASRPSWKVLSKFLVSPLGHKSSESSLASDAIVFTAAALRPAVTEKRWSYSPGSPPAAPPPGLGRIVRVCRRSRRARAEKRWFSLSSPWKELPFANFRASCSCKRRRGETRTGYTVPSTKMAQQRRMLMCYYTVAIRSSGPWTLSQHLGPSKEPASNIPPASDSGSHTLQSR